MNFIQHTRAAHELLTRRAEATPLHVSLYWALFFEWNATRFAEAVELDHERMMRAAHIGNRKVYRATLYALETWGLLAYRPSRSRHQATCFLMSDLLGTDVPQAASSTGGTSAPSSPPLTEGTSAPGNQALPGTEVPQADELPGAEVPQADELPGADVPQPLLIGNKHTDKSKQDVVVNGPAAAPKKNIGETSPENEGLSGLAEEPADDSSPNPGAAPKKKVAPKKKGVHADTIRAAATAARDEPRRRAPLPELPFRQSTLYDFEAFTAAFAGTDYALADLRHYHQLIDNWRDKKTGLPPLRRDWVATSKKFMLNDAADNRLKLAPGTNQHQPGQSGPDPGTRPAPTGYRSKYDA
jgi:hypothetical protein